MYANENPPSGLQYLPTLEECQGIQALLDTLNTKGPGVTGGFHSWKPASELGSVT